jgi:hypothetical protein
MFNPRLQQSIYDTMVVLGYDSRRSMFWTRMWEVYFENPDQSLVVDVLTNS